MAKDSGDDGKTDDQENDGVLDMSQAAVKKMIADARAKGYITYDQLNRVLPPDQVASEQIEDVMSMLSEMGINIIEDEEAEDDDAENKGSTEVVETSTSREVAVAQTETEKLDRTDDPVRMYLREMGSVELLSREGEIAIAKRIEAGPQHDDRGPLRKPADLPGHHHLARGTSERRHSAARRDRPGNHLRSLDGRGGRRNRDPRRRHHKRRSRAQEG